ncbi:MAG: hypothetical protein HYV36_04085 [Lentisphaerae bacterium]|nr:hypothetical protein [Lentisphaerota bacterium]
MANGRRARLWILVYGVLCATQLYALATRYAWAGDGFTLTDYLGRVWTNEAVRFPIAGNDLKLARAGAALLRQGYAGQALVGQGTPVLYQLLPSHSIPPAQTRFPISALRKPPT